MKKPPRTYSLGDDDIFQLFDVGEADHLRALLADLADPVPESERKAMADNLRCLLGVVIEKMRGRILESGRGENAAEYESLDRFATAVEVAALQLPGPLDKAGAQDIADNLHMRWIAFIAYSCAWRMYHDLPRELATTARRTAPMISRRDAEAYAVQIDHKNIVAEYARRKAAGESKIAKTLAEEYGKKQGTIKNIWSKRDK